VGLLHSFDSNHIKTNTMELFDYTRVFPPEDSRAGIGGFDLNDIRDQVIAFDYNSTGRLDHLALYRPGAGKIWIVEKRGGGFIPKMFVDAYGIAGFDLSNSNDRMFAFDFNSSGKLDHLVLYRPGTVDGDGIYILKKGPTGYERVATLTNPVIPQFENHLELRHLHTNARVFAFDFTGSGKLDHIVIHNREIIWIVKKDQSQSNRFVKVNDGGVGINDYILSSQDQMISFDFSGSGKRDHLVVYRPGSGLIHIVKKDPATPNNNGKLITIFRSQSSGVGGYDLMNTKDQIISFDYLGTGRLDHLVLYRPGKGTLWILKNENGIFSPVYMEGEPGIGIGGYDLASVNDRVIAFDYGIGKLEEPKPKSRLNHLLMYRPGTGTVWILKSKNALKPIVNGVFPMEGLPGDLISIQGQHFDRRGHAPRVGFNGGTSEVVAEFFTDTTIGVKVPANVATGQIIVRTLAGDSNLSAPFTRIPLPEVTKILPVSAQAGDTVHIYGHNFKRVITNGIRFNNHIATAFRTISAEEIVATLPADFYGPMQVFTQAGASNIFDYRKPDIELLGTGISRSFGDNNFSHEIEFGAPYFISVQTKNSGGALSAECKMRVTIRNSSRKLIFNKTVKSFGMHSMEPGSSTNYFIRHSDMSESPLVRGSYSLSVFLDSENIVDEINETNNASNNNPGGVPTFNFKVQ
jgi:hypothetical protein